ncbi:MAG: DMT family transporter [Pseudomonadota bacterium]|nr:DMT family transporter [Pseudomonadota bacterium]
MALTARLALLMTVPPLLWAGNAVVGRMMAGQVPPLTLNLLRWVLAALLLLPLGWRALRPFSRIWRRWPYLLLIGFLGVGSYNALQYLALVTSTPLNITLVASSMPVWMLAIGALFYGEPISTRQWVGAALGLAGVALVLSHGQIDTLLEVRLVAGDVYILLATIGFSFYSWLLARPPAHMRGDRRPRADEGWDWAGILLVQALFGLVAAGGFSAGEQLLGAPPIHWSLGVFAALAYVSLGASVVAYRCWGLGVAEGGPALAAIFNNLTPLFAALLSASLLGELPHLYHVIAFGLIVASIAVSMRRRA